MGSPQPATIVQNNNSTPSRSDVDDILRKKRKIREHKACYPCRTRKVRCDSNVPCKTCIDRNHADLCTFNPPNKRRDSGSSHGQEPSPNLSVAIKKDDWTRLCNKFNDMEKSMKELRYDMSKINGPPGPGSEDVKPSIEALDSPKDDTPDGPRYVKALEMHEQSHLSGDSIHLGGGSVPAMVAALGRGKNIRRGAKEVLSKGTLPIFGLDNESATYPFVSLFGQQSAATRIQELRKVIPEDHDCLEALRNYRDGAHVTYPAVANIDQFETELNMYLQNRSMSQQPIMHDPATDHMDGMSLRWIALLFALLASGVQFSPMPRNERDLLSQVYVCCSFECLRMVNYLSNVSVETIQTFLVLGNVLSNAMNPGAAWSLLGMTIRLAQTLGLHSASEHSTLGPKEVTRSRTWWATLWQDSLLSISYDRASSAATVDCPYTPIRGESAGSRSFFSSMERICKIALDTVRNRVAPQSIHARLARCVDLRMEINRAQQEAAGTLRNVKNCGNPREQAEYWTLYLHASFMLSELCRPAISPSTAEFDKNNELRRQCISHLQNVVEAFVGLANVSPFHTRSWSVVHRALSSALLLGILGEPSRNSKVQELLQNLITLMRKAATLTDAGELSAPVARSLSALHKLSAPESRTPRQLEENANNGPDVKPILPNPGNMSQNGHSNGLDLSAAGTPSSVATVPSKASSAMTNGTNNTLATESSLFDPNTTSGPPPVSSGLDAFNLAGLDESNFFLPNPLDGFEDDSSPYALMDSIIWGGSTPGGANRML